jgi:hypothetical protein
VIDATGNDLRGITLQQQREGTSAAPQIEHTFHLLRGHHSATVEW